MESWLEQHDDLSVEVRNDVEKELQTLESDPNARYSTLKRRLSRVYKMIHGDSSWPPSTIKDLARLVITDENFEEQLSRLATQALQQQDDFAFATALQSIAEKDEVFNEVVEEFRVLMVELLRQKIIRLSSSIPDMVKESLYTSIDRDLGQTFEQRKQTEEAVAWQNLKEKVQECLSQATTNANDW